MEINCIFFGITQHSNASDLETEERKENVVATCKQLSFEMVTHNLT